MLAQFILDCTFLYILGMFQFFLVSGILVQSRGQGSGSKPLNIKKNAKKYLIPYYVFSFLYMFVVGTFKLLQRDGSAFTFIIHSIKWIVLLDGGTAMWFLPCLLFVEIVFYIEEKYLPIGLLAVLNSIFAVCVMYLTQKRIAILIVVFLRCFVDLLFYSVGYLIAMVVKKYKIIFRYMISVILLGGVLYL